MKTLLVLLFLMPLTLHAKTRPCKRGEGPLRRVATRELLQEEIMNAIQTGKRTNVMTLASCDFIIGLPDSDISRVVPPEKAVPKVLKTAKKFKWMSSGFDSGTQYNISIEGDNVKARHELILRGDESGWFWAGYATSDAKLLKEWSKDAYPEPPKEPAPK